ncbi:hypothetical protein Tco_0596161 [Tanacetum coccineum]
MSSITAQQTKLDLELVPKEKRLDIGKCNGRLNPGKIQREPTFQVVLDALALTPCYSAFLITADVPEVYMHRDLGQTGEIRSLNDVVVDQMHQPWRTFAALINKSLSGNTIGLDKPRLSRAQILWGMYHQKNVDYVELLWEDFIYQIDNKAYKKQEDSNQEEDEEKIEDDEEEEEDEIVKNPCNNSNDEDEINVTNKAEAEIVSPLDVLVHHEVPSQQTSTLLTVHVSVIFESSPVFSIVIPQSLQSFSPPPLLSTPTPPPTTEATNPPSTLPELMSTAIDFSAFIMNGLKIDNLTQEILLGPAFRLLKGTRSNYAELEYDFEECYKALLEKLDWENPEGGDYPFNLTKPLPLVMSRNRQKVPIDYFFNNDLKYLQGGISTMTYITSITKTKANQYDLPGIKDMVPNICVPVKVAYDKHALWGKSTTLERTTKSLSMEIVVRRADNDLYRFKEGDFPRLHINDIENMLLLLVHNRLKNLSGDDDFKFIIALRMFTRSLVIQKRVKDLQLGVESYQKNINVTKPQTTISDIRKIDPYTPYQDPQGFIYVDTLGRNRLIRSDELYKFSDRTLIGIRTSLDDITKNIQTKYLPKRCWSTLEKKRANIIIKAIDKQMKERRLMRSLEKFVGGRHYGTDLRLL